MSGRKQTTLSSFFGSKFDRPQTADVLPESSQQQNDKENGIVDNTDDVVATETQKRKSSDSDSSSSSKRVGESSSGSKEKGARCSGVKSKRVKKFNDDWRNDFRWLRTEGDGTDKLVMYCRICEEADKKNGFTRGCVNLQRSALCDHRESDSHHAAVIALSHKTAMKTHINQVREKNHDSLIAMMRTVLFLAKENIAASKFSSLLELQKRNGCASLLTGVIYSHQDSVEQMEEALVMSTVNDLKNIISQSNFVGLIMDETVNVSVEKKLILFLKTVKNGAAETIFLGNYTVHNGTAECIAEKTREVLADWDIPTAKLVGLGSDGASVMTGKHSGVGKRLKDANPYLVHVHCIAHRVALASQDAARLSKHVAEYRTTLNDLYKLFEYSATRYNRLRELSKVLDDSEFASVKQPTTVRWLSLGRAVSAVKSNWPALVIETEEEAADRKNNVAVNISRKMKTYQFIATTYMMSDVLPHMEKLVTVFQKEQINLSMIKPMVVSTTECLRELLENPGENEQYLNDNIVNGEFRGIKLNYADDRSVRAFDTKRKTFIEDLVMSLDKRFPTDSLDVIHALDDVLNPLRYPTSRDELTAHGGESLDILLEHYGRDADEPVIGQEGGDVTTPEPIIDKERTRREFSKFKRCLFGMGVQSFEKACALLIKDYGDVFPDFSLLAQIALIIPVTSVPAERGFSLQNRIHTNSRNRLSQRHLNNLMMLNWHAGDADQCCKNAATLFRNKKRKA